MIAKCGKFGIKGDERKLHKYFPLVILTLNEVKGKNLMSSLPPRLPRPSKEGLAMTILHSSLRAKRGNLIAFSSHHEIATGLTPLAMTEESGIASSPPLLAMTGRELAMTVLCMFGHWHLGVLNLFRV